MNVPRGTIFQSLDNSDDFEKRMDIFADLINKWNVKINLISPNSMPDLWNRHILDSLQLVQYVPRGTNLALDMGSGGGFPALVLSAALPKIQWILAESDQRKSVFLRQAVREMDLNAKVVSERIENINLPKQDLVTARALADLNQLLEWSSAFIDDQSYLIFPKGKTWKTELTRAQQNWQMAVEEFVSQTDAQAKILRLSKVARQ